MYVHTSVGVWVLVWHVKVSACIVTGCMCSTYLCTRCEWQGWTPGVLSFVSDSRSSLI